MILIMCTCTNRQNVKTRVIENLKTRKIEKGSLNFIERHFNE